jgi:hypothetical protein
MITIQHLEVQFEVEGDDRQRFASLFLEHMKRWAAEAEDRRRRELRSARDRSLGDSSDANGIML